MSLPGRMRRGRATALDPDTAEPTRIGAIVDPMGQLGDLFPGAKLQREDTEDADSGQTFEPGPLDLDSGVIRLRPRPATSEPAKTTDQSAAMRKQ